MLQNLLQAVTGFILYFFVDRKAAKMKGQYKNLIGGAKKGASKGKKGASKGVKTKRTTRR